MSACTSNNDVLVKSSPRYINNETKFSQAAYGVAASPRVTTARNIKKGGGRRQVGKPYKIRGKWYHPKEEPGYDRKGQASWYGPNFHGRLTANGEVYDQFALTAAHPTFPLPSYARVTNMENGRSVVVRVNDRGPYHSGRVIDLSAKASEMLDYQSKGVANVRVQYIKQAPLHGQDQQFLLASYRGDNLQSPSVIAAASQSVPPGSENLPDAELDETSTGSIAGPVTTASASPTEVIPEQVPAGPVVEDLVPAQETIGRDPFLEELEAVKKKRDTGSTLSLRAKIDPALATR